MSCRCFSDCGNDGWRIATMKGSYKTRFQKSRSTTIGKIKVFNTRFDVLSQDVESSKTPSSSPRLSGFCESPSLDNTEKVATGHDDFQQALKDPDFAKAVRGLELCLKIRERERLQGDGGTAFACGPRGGCSAGGNESFSEGTECVSGPVAAGIKGVRSALGVRDGVEGTRTALDSAGETKGIIGLPEGIESDFSKNLADITASNSDPVMGATAGATAG